MSRKMVILTQGHSNPHTAKTACSLLRYRAEEVVALLDSQQAGKTAQDVLGVGGTVPFVANLDEAMEANTLAIGIAPTGGRIPKSWRPILQEAIRRGMDVLSGLHDFVSDDPEFSELARQYNVQLYDVRKNQFKQIAKRQRIRSDCLRIHTVGHDCSVGKMVTSIEITRELQRRGLDAKFVATGQTGIMVEGDGLPIDCVVADFVNGAAEELVLRNQSHDILLIEGQGSLVHPSYSAVTLGLLHGCMPHGLILCYEIGREVVTGVESVRIPPLADIKRLYEVMANVAHPCEVIGIAMNSRQVTEDFAQAERERMRAEFGLPVTDVFRYGPDELVEAVIQLRDRVLPSTD